MTTVNELPESFQLSLEVPDHLIFASEDVVFVSDVFCVHRDLFYEVFFILLAYTAIR